MYKENKISQCKCAKMSYLAAVLHNFSTCTTFCLRQKSTGFSFPPSHLKPGLDINTGSIIVVWDQFDSFVPGINGINASDNWSVS